MYSLPPSRKRYLLKQNSALRASIPKQPPGSPTSPSYAASYGPSSASALLPRLVPQLTGDTGLMRRLSMAGWGASAPPVVTAESPQRTSGEFDVALDLKSSRKAQLERAAEAQPLQPQMTGSLWGSWWTSSSTMTSGDGSKTAKSYVERLQSPKAMDKKLASHLISLRVHLSTAKVAWIEEFITAEKGLIALGGLLTTLVGKGGKRRLLNEAENTVLAEVIKCFRALLNTEVS